MGKATVILGMLIEVFAFSLGFVSVAHGAAPMLTVAVQGVCVLKARPGGDESLKYWGGVPGTSVLLVVTEPTGRLVRFDDYFSDLKAFVDNKGKDLTAGKVEITKPGNPFFSGDWDVSTDHKHCSVQVVVPGIPTKDATSLSLSGALVFRMSNGTKQFTAEKLALRAGAKFSAGKIPLTIERAGKPQFGAQENPFEITFRGGQGFDAIKRIEFFDSGGKAIKAAQSSRAFGNVVNGRPAPDYWVTIDYDFRRAVETATIVVTCWMDMKEVTIPFNLKVSLGL